LVFSVWDYNEHRKNTLLSSTTFELAGLTEDSTRENIVSNLLSDGKERGELKYDISYYPVIEPEEGKEDSMNTS